MISNGKDENIVPFETALDRAGFGRYSYMLVSLSGIIIISFVCIVYNSTIIIPASACELNTTSAQQGLLASAPVVGVIVGTLVWGYLADTRGRRKMLLLSLFLGAVINIVCSISVNWIMLMILQFLASMMVAGQFALTMTLLSESVPMAKRNLVLLLVTSIFLLAQGTMAVIAIPVIPLSFSYHLPALGIYWNSWRTALVVYSVPSLISLCWLYFIKESPKFAFANNDEEGAIKILKVIHRINNKRGEILEVSGIIRPEMDQTVTMSAKDQILPLFKRPLLKSVVLMTTLNVFQMTSPFMVWLPTIANQFINIVNSGEGSDLTLCGIIDLSLNTPAEPDAVPCALNVTALLLVLIVGSLQSLVNLGISLVVNNVGRRNMVMILMSVCGTFGILVNLVPNAVASFTFFMIQLLGTVSLGLYTAITVSLFPTHLRAMAVALTMIGGRFGTFASIQILNLLLVTNCEVGFYVFSAMIASSAVVASFLPDDRRLRPKPEPTRDESSKL